MLSEHPDCTSYIMDDGNVFLMMNHQIYGVMQGSKAGISKNDKTVPVNVSLLLRGNCLQSAKKNKIIAIIEPEESNNINPDPVNKKISREELEKMLDEILMPVIKFDKNE